MWRGFALVFVAAGCFLMSAPEMVAAAPPNTLGDADCSGIVNPDDIVAILIDHALEDPAPCTSLADVQCDGDIDARDVLELLRFAADLEPDQAEGCGPIGEALDAPRFSHDLIELALAGADIDAETAILYHFYAAFNDSRLPDEYDGDDSSVTENPALHKLPGLWDSLSQATRDLILPFLRTPPEPDSWYNQIASPSGGIQWNTVSSASHPVKIWWQSNRPGDEARALAMAGVIDSDIWFDVTQDLMGASPLPDCGAGCPSGGGDEKLDVYLIGDIPETHYTSWNPPDNVTCENTPAFIVLLPDASPATLTHEFMHAVQFALPYANGDGCDDGWWWEATATAAEDYVWRNAYNDEQQNFAPAFLTTAHKPLEDDSGQREYGAYLFPFYLDRVRNNPGLTGDIFFKMGTEADTLKAIESTVSGALGEFGEVWRDFTLKNWNKEPEEDYKDLDSLEYGATPSAYNIRIGETEIDDANVEHMAAIYAKFTPLSNVRTIVFTNTLAGMEHASVTAIKKVRGEWKDSEDWSDDSEKEFCRDRPSEDISELIIIIANGDAVGKNALDADPPTIEGKAEGCSGWEGTITVVGDDVYGTRNNGSGTGIVFEMDEGGSVLHYPIRGTGHWTSYGINGIHFGCEVTGAVDFDVADINNWRGVGLFVDNINNRYDIELVIDLPDATQFYDCPPPYEGSSGEFPWLSSLSLIPYQNGDFALKEENGVRIAQDSIVQSDFHGFQNVTYSWRLVEYGTDQ